METPPGDWKTRVKYDAVMVSRNGPNEVVVDAAGWQARK